jgi:hypothetical protein
MAVHLSLSLDTIEAKLGSGEGLYEWPLEVQLPVFHEQRIKTV